MCVVVLWPRAVVCKTTTVMRTTVVAIRAARGSRRWLLAAASASNIYLFWRIELVSSRLLRRGEKHDNLFARTNLDAYVNKVALFKHPQRTDVINLVLLQQLP